MSENSANQTPPVSETLVPSQTIMPAALSQAYVPETPEAPSYFGIEQAEITQLTQQLNSAASWFYVIAGLSVVNSLIAAFGSSIRFIFGLGITGVVDGIVTAMEFGAAGKLIGLVVSIFLAGLFAIFGFLAKKRLHWAFLVGMGIYLLDGLLLLLFESYLSAAFHAYVLYRLFQGLSASRKLSTMTTN